MEKVLVLNFGGKFNLPIAHRVREQNIYAEIIPYTEITVDEIVERGYKGVIFTGGPDSVYEPDAPKFDPAILNAGVPILGIGYGCHLIAYMAGGKVTDANETREFGNVDLVVVESELFDALPLVSTCYMSHRNYIKEVPRGFKISAFTELCPTAAIENPDKKIYGVQFHPEVSDTECGDSILTNFLYHICGCSGEWKMENLSEEKVSEYREGLSGKKVVCALSGGIDSSVAALLIHRAIGDNLTCIFVDNGLLRKGEVEFVKSFCRDTLKINVVVVDAAERFLNALKGITNPDEKRRVISDEFASVFKEEAAKLETVDVLVQGTMFTDVLQRGAGDISTVIDAIEFKETFEPLRDLLKDEIRNLGIALGIPAEIAYRQPFPGPGLALRCVGEVTAEKLAVLREADYIFAEEIAKAGYERYTNQYFAVLTDTLSVGITGSTRITGKTIVLRAVTSDDFLTADWTRLPYEILDSASTRITHEIEGITRVVYDITPKPPATVEWQ